MIYLALIIITISITAYNYFKVPKHLSNIPKISFIDQLKSFRKNVLTDEHYSKVIYPKLREKGYAVRWFRGKWSLIVAKPEVAKDLFRNGQQFFKIENKVSHTLFSKFIGSVNIVSANQEWKRLRKPANPIFHQTFQPDIFSDCALEVIDVFMSRVKENGDEPIQISDLMNLLTLQVFGKGLLDFDFKAISSLGSAEYYILYTSIMKNLISPLYFLMPFLERFPIGKRLQAHKDVKQFNQFIQGIIDQRRKDLENDKYKDSKDLLSTMLREDPDNTYAPLTDQELIHNLNVFFIAGHDTTANTLSYAMYHLAKNQHVQDKLRAEIYNTLQVDPNNQDLVTPTSEQIKSMNYMACFIKEVMRITPAVLQVNRQLQSDYTIPGENVVLPTGTQITLSIYSIQHDPKIYPNPEEFDPERFLNGKYDTDIYCPFGGGSRMCIGSNFSLMEQKVYLTLLLQKFTLDIKQDNPDFNKLRIKGLGLTRPQDLKLNLVPRF